MANIFKIDRTANSITLGTTGTTINIASHTASRLLALDASKDLEVVTIGSSLDYTRPTLDTVQDIRTSASPYFTGIELGHASDTTLTRVSAGVVAIEGTNIAMVGGAHHDGFSDFVANEHIDHTSVTLTAGTGLTGGGDISANRTFAVDGLLEDLDTLGPNSADSEFLVGTGAGVLAWESGATARTSIGLGTTNSPQFAKLGINVAAPASGLLRVYDATVSTTLLYRGFENLHIKTAGVTDVNDTFYGINNYIGYNQSGGVLGITYGFFNYFILTDGDIGDASNVKSLYTNYNLTQLTGGKIYGNAYGLYTSIDQRASNEVTVDIYGHYIDIDSDGTVGGSVYGLYLNEGSNVDYGIYQNGTAPNRFGGSLDVGSAISSATSTFSTAGPTDNVDVSGVNTLFIDTSSNSVTIGGFAGGVDGQVLYVIRTSNVNNVIIEHNEAEATQKIYLHAGADETLGTEYGGWVFVCHGGVDWHDASHAKHVP